MKNCLSKSLHFKSTALAVQKDKKNKHILVVLVSRVVAWMQLLWIDNSHALRAGSTKVHGQRNTDRISCDKARSAKSLLSK